MQEASRKVAIKHGLDIDQIEVKSNTQRNLEVLGDDLTFLGYREFERTKHVHRLHLYLGKFIPQLAEVFLKKYFQKATLSLTHSPAPGQLYA